MTETPAPRSFVVPVGLLLAGVILGILAVGWLVLGTEPFMDEAAAPTGAPTRPWLPLVTGLLSLGALCAGLRSLTHTDAHTDTYTSARHS